MAVVVVLVVVVVGGCDGFRSRCLLLFQAIDVLRKYVVAVVVVVGVLLLLLFVSLFLCLFLNSCACFFLWRLFVRGECWCRSRSFLFLTTKYPHKPKGRTSQNIPNSRASKAEHAIKRNSEIY